MQPRLGAHALRAAFGAHSDGRLAWGAFRTRRTRESRRGPIATHSESALRNTLESRRYLALGRTSCASRVRGFMVGALRTEIHVSLQLQQLRLGDPSQRLDPGTGAWARAREGVRPRTALRRGGTDALDRARTLASGLALATQTTALTSRCAWSRELPHVTVLRPGTKRKGATGNPVAL